MTRFVVDTMLGTLAKWLRALGYDAAYLPHAPDGEILALSERESRVVLTRDAELARRAGPMGLLVGRGKLDEQLVSVAGMYPDRDFAPLTRCMECNGALSAVDKAEALADGSVPPGVAGRVADFWRCRTCGRIYWKGSHYAAMSKKIQELFPGSPGLL
jgi:uncharacterized protein with PIN domain